MSASVGLDGSARTGFRPSLQCSLLRYWILTDGRAVVWSLMQLAEKKLDELIDPAAPEAYHAAG